MFLPRVDLSHTLNRTLGEDLLLSEQPTPANSVDSVGVGWSGTASTRLLRLTLSHVVADQRLYDQNFKWVTTGPFEVTWPLVGEANFSESQNKVDEDTGTIMSENCRPRKSWGVRLKSKCYHDDHDDHVDGDRGHDDNDEIRRNSCLGWFLSDLVFDGSRLYRL